MQVSIVSLLALIHLVIGANLLHAQGTAFTYQGRLNDGAGPANGNYDFRFRLASDPLANNYVGGNVFTSAVPISNGLFIATLDFAGAFNGSNYWLEVAVRTNGGVAYTTLSPLQPLTPAPHRRLRRGREQCARRHPERRVERKLFWGGDIQQSGKHFQRRIQRQRRRVDEPECRDARRRGRERLWKTAGNNGTTPGANFLGTTDNQPLELRVNGRRASRLEPTTDVGTTRSNMVNVVNGSAVNVVAAGVRGATISGGGAGFYDGFSYTNSVAADLGTIAGGAGNILQVFFRRVEHRRRQPQQDSRLYNATIAGGVDNTIQGSALSAAIAGGQANQIETNALASTIGGGSQNTIQTLAYLANVGGYNSTIAGGLGNIIGSPYATIGGGGYNTIGTNSNTGVISGGYGNTIANHSWDVTIGGGSYPPSERMPSTQPLAADRPTRLETTHSPQRSRVVCRIRFGPTPFTPPLAAAR